MSAVKRGYDYRWVRFSRAFLTRHPRCERCNQEAAVTDHRLTIEVMRQLFGGDTYQDEHYAPLCRRCNGIKGREEDPAIRESYGLQRYAQRQGEGG